MGGMDATNDFDRKKPGSRIYSRLQRGSPTTALHLGRCRFDEVGNPTSAYTGQGGKSNGWGLFSGIRVRAGTGWIPARFRKAYGSVVWVAKPTGTNRGSGLADAMVPVCRGPAGYSYRGPDVLPVFTVVVVLLGQQCWPGDPVYFLLLVAGGPRWASPAGVAGPDPACNHLDRPTADTKPLVGFFFLRRAVVKGLNSECGSWITGGFTGA